ncbi:MAG: hypothetical protein ACM3NN_16440 [Nitrospirota bacterium]|jgi:hypothetical protein
MPSQKWLLLLVGSTCVFAVSLAAQLLVKQQTLGDGIVVQVIGEGNRQGLRIMRDGRTIYKNMLNDGSITFKCVRASEDGKRYNVAARFGSHGDLYKAYAIVGNSVFPSPKYRNTASGDTDIPADWSTPDRLEIKGTQPNTLSFDPARQKWAMAKGIVLH